MATDEPMKVVGTYPSTRLFIDGIWRAGGCRPLDIVNPATKARIGTVESASIGDLEAAVVAAARAFAAWRKTSALDRSAIMRRAAALLRERADGIAVLMTMEQGKPVAEARAEALAGADIVEWFAEEGRRTYGRIIPPRLHSVTQMAMKEPVGVVAAFTPWNFPINQAVRKVSAALASGCSIILKGPEETPASCAALVSAFADAGLPPGCLNLVFGVPAEISAFLIPHPDVAKISFTGSSAVGKQLAALAGAHMKRVSMELGGHAPALVFADADIGLAASMLSTTKFRNAGQVCIAPTRILVEDKVFDVFVDAFSRQAEGIVVGDGLQSGVTMGPLANARRLEAIERMTTDAAGAGADIITGGSRIGNRGYFFQPTIVANLGRKALAMNDEPFGPLAIVNRFHGYDEAIEEANRLRYGLAAYAYTSSARTSAALGRDLASGMVAINHHAIAFPELPFGGIRDSGYGSEGGAEAMEAYLNTKLITHAA